MHLCHNTTSCQLDQLQPQSLLSLKDTEACHVSHAKFRDWIKSRDIQYTPLIFLRVVSQVAAADTSEARDHHGRSELSPPAQKQY